MVSVAIVSVAVVSVAVVSVARTWLSSMSIFSSKKHSLFCSTDVPRWKTSTRRASCAACVQQAKA